MDPVERAFFLKQVNALAGGHLLSKEAEAEFGPLVLSKDGRRRPRAPRGSRTGTVAVLLTLTYAEAGAWKPGHIGAFRRARSEWARRRGVRYRACWVAEVGERRGRLHYHILEFWPIRIETPPFPDAGQWGYGMSQAVWVAADAIRYLAKYLGKPGQVLPEGIRSSGVVGLSLKGREELSRMKLPGYVRPHCQGEAPARRAPGGGWLFPGGVWRPALYAVQFDAAIWRPVCYVREDRRAAWELVP